MSSILLPYIHYVALYLGVALTGGSVVHLPLAPGRYLLIGLVGVVVFILASVADARRRHATAVEGESASIGSYIGWSVLLSIGLGMLSGSIQHFLDFPHYAAVLLPLGVLLSLAAYVGRERLSLSGPKLVKLGAAAVSFALVLALGLDLLADELVPHGHDH
ncbi:hypothetical protein [Belnapia moabensis]|uniref:hypothetical protein n=1 Tax=Belnapia moabensis TaxID=365533 RepID=UPI0005BCFBC8|nr:hypothetical protein [Belnapia moabensis]